jgi:hypothetical protein
MPEMPPTASVGVTELDCVWPAGQGCAPLDITTEVPGLTLLQGTASDDQAPQLLK